MCATDVQGSIENLNLYGICVEDCPQAGDYICNYEGEKTFLPNKVGASATAAQKKTGVYDCYAEMWSSGVGDVAGIPGMGILSDALMSSACKDVVANCWINPIDTKRMLYRCIPKFWSVKNTGKECVLPESAGNTSAGVPVTAVSPDNPACITYKQTGTDVVDIPKGAEVIFDIMAGIAGRVMRSLSDVTYSWYVIAICGFGVSFAVLLPNAMSEPWYRVMGNNPLWGPFWGVFGSFDVSGPLALEKAIAEDGDVLVEQLEPTTTLTPILLWIYQFVAAIILINLLIAQMADTYGRVTADGLVRWQFERAALISEYKDTKPPLPPPANLLCFTYNLLQWLLAKFCPGFVGEEEVTPGFQKVPDTMQLRILERRENSALKECLRQRARRKKASPETKAEELRLNLAKLEDQSRARFEKLDDQSRARFENFEQQNITRFEKISDQLDASSAMLELIRKHVSVGGETLL